MCSRWRRPGLISTETVKAKKGHQKICSARFDEIIVRFESDEPRRDANMVEVAMPLGLFTSVEVGAPCGLCSTDGVIGLLDVPDFFLDPARVQAALIWFGRGNVEYKFPNNAKLLNAGVEIGRILDGAVVGGARHQHGLAFRHHALGQPHRVGTWTSPGDFGDKRGVYSPNWWKLEGSQYGKLKTWRSTSRAPSSTACASPTSPWPTSNPQAPLDPHAHRHRRQGRASRRPQHFRPGLRQLDQDIVMRLRLRR